MRFDEKEMIIQPQREEFESEMDGTLAQKIVADRWREIN
jgi:hypothetical protein